jgi:CDP-diacylglycerol--glycerol-3-phosphate 3-phosphatidyltransferase
MSVKKYIPNAISIARIILSFVMLFITRYRVAFIVVYAITALTDKLDGSLARHWKVSSHLGAQLDSVGDVTIFACGLAALALMLWHKEIIWEFTTIPMLGAYLLIKIAVFLLTYFKSGKWYMLHTYLDKLLGGLLYISIPVVVYLGGVKVWWVSVIMVFCVLSAIEDTIYVCKANEVNPDYKGLLFEKINAE